MEKEEYDFVVKVKARKDISHDVMKVTIQEALDEYLPHARGWEVERISVFRS